MFRPRILTAGTVHGAEDTTNDCTVAALASDASWTQIAALADDLRTQYEGHRALVDSVHGAADSTNTVSAAAVGAVQTSLNTCLNEIKTDFNAHIAEVGTSHRILDESMSVTAADASSLATSRTLANAVKTAYTDHISKADETAAHKVITPLDEEE